MQKFYVCKKCGTMVALVKKGHCIPTCCGDEMTELIAGEVEASKEKHIPVINVNGNIVTVTVGEVEHPMIDVHYIEWISIETNLGNQRKVLKPNDAPKAQFALLDGEKVIAAYAYCNLHGLWKANA
jgi:superoxide reductase